MGAAWSLLSRQHAVEASPDLLPISLKFQDTSTNNKLGIQTPTQLPTDIINEIIERLPAISNFRFKCVSKQWCSLNFEALKLKSQTHAMSGIFYVTDKSVRVAGVKYVKTENDQNDDFYIDGTLSFLPVPEHHYIKIHDSCNGLLLCESWHMLYSPTNNSFQSSSLHVCNPAMRKWVKIPNIPTKYAPIAFLDFNPLVSIHFNVIIIMHECQVCRNIEVFSSKTGEWSVSQIMDPLLSQCRCCIPYLFFEGLIFAIVLERTEMIGFDVKGKLCSRIDLPGMSYMNNDPFLAGLDQLGGCLHYYCRNSKSKIYIWKLESGSWLLKSCFSVTSPRGYIKSVKLHPIKDDVVFLLINDRLCSYNIKTTQLVELCSRILADNYFMYSPFYLDVLGSGGR